MFISLLPLFPVLLEVTPEINEMISNVIPSDQDFKPGAACVAGYSPRSGPPTVAPRVTGSVAAPGPYRKNG
ncbi:MAG: hypothetical protein QG577_1742 [Thermodesulfobacteriota bacterium]|nr:hypothetical protein [Thermodesulfobacteriota bacterium]